MNAIQLVDALLANGDDPKDYIDQTLPDDRYIIVHSKHPEDYFINVSNPEDPRLTFERSGATVLKLDDAQRICADINKSTSEEDRYIVLPVEHDVIEALLDGPDDFDPSDEAKRALESVSRDQLFAWLEAAGVSDYSSHGTSMGGKNYLEYRGYLTGSSTQCEDRFIEQFLNKWGFGEREETAVVWSLDNQNYAQPVKRAIRVLIPTTAIRPDERRTHS